MNTPLRNSKGANKPFRSPFSNVSSCQMNATNSDLQKRKRTLHESPVKKRRTDNEITKSNSKKSDTKKTNVKIDLNDITHADLEAKKQKVKDLQRTVTEMRTKLLYQKNTKAETLEEDIKKWRDVCQMALERLLKETRERHDTSCTMSQLLSSLGIPESLVKYSNEADDFVE